MTAFPVLEPATNQKILGNAYPKWVAGISNTITYKSFSLYFLFDGHFDVQKYDQLNNFMAAFGIAKYTENRNQTMVFNGVLENGTQKYTNRSGWDRVSVRMEWIMAMVITEMYTEE